MTSQSRRYQTQWAAQFYVAAELTRRGYQVAFTLGNAPKTDLMVSTPDDSVQFKIDVKGQSTRNFWLVQKRAIQDDLYYILVYLAKDGSEPPRFFMLSCAQMMQERKEYRKHIESTSGKYQEDMGGMNWSTAFGYEDKWDILPGGQGSESVRVLQIPPIVLEWSEWVPWSELAADTGTGDGIAVPHVSGVYEAKYQDQDIRLTIGQSSDLHQRVKRQLVQGKGRHSTRDRMKENQVDFARVVVRWAVTDWHVAAEAALHRQHEEKLGCPPVYTLRT